MTCTSFPAHLLIGIALIGCANAFIPPACTANVSTPDATCCPTPKGYKNPCGFPSRGICRPVQVFQQPPEKGFEYWFKNDFRINWPSRVFKHTCECMREYDGMDCGKCWFGYEGKNCEKRVIRIRKNALKMTKQEKTNLWKVLVQSTKAKSPLLIPTISSKEWKLGPPYRNVTVHEEIMFRYWFARFPIVTDDAKKCKKYGGKNGVDYGGGQPINPLFHRLFLLYWEERLQAIAKSIKIQSFTFPYWDFTDAKKCEVCRNDILGKELPYMDLGTNAYFLDYDSPYASWGAHCSMRYRSPCGYCGEELKLDVLTRKWLNTNFPTTADVRRVLEVPLFYSKDKCQSFAYWITGGKGCFCDKNRVTMLDQFYKMTGGTFSNPLISPNDPLYILVHGNLDRLLARWYRRMLSSSREMPTFWGSEPGSCRLCTFVPFTPAITLEDILVDTQTLGYQYDNLNFGKLKESSVVAEIGQRFVPLTAKCKKHG